MFTRTTPHLTKMSVMLRLKALDGIAGNVKNLTVLRGTEGLMNGLVRLGG